MLHLCSVSFLGGSKEDGKLNEAFPLLWVLAKHVHHLMNKQLSVCFFLQMVCFPPPHVFLFLLLCFLLSNPSGPQSSIGYRDWFRVPFTSWSFRKHQNKTESDTFRWSQLHKDFPVLINSCWRCGFHLRVGLCSVLSNNPKKSQTCYATTPTHLKFHTEDHIFSS